MMKVPKIIIPEARPLFSTTVLSATRAILLGKHNPRDMPIKEAIIEVKMGPSAKARRTVENIPKIIDVNSNFLRLIPLPMKLIVIDQKIAKP
ncbi:MAG: hypothetical protein ACFFCW_45245 [Candidatus Hodarchaeota archaeon]